MARPQEEVGCPECGTQNPLNSKFCESCGLRLVQQRPAEDQEEASAAPPPSRRGKAGPSARGAEKREIERLVGKARDKLKTIRNVLFLMATLMGVSLLATWLRFGDAVDLSMVLAIQGSAMALLLCGALFLFDQPLFWVSSCAGLFTVFTGLFVYYWNAIQFGLNGLIAVGLWASLPMVLNLTRLQKEHPELVNADRLRSRQRSSVSGAAAKRLDDLMQRRRQQARRSYMLVGGIVLAGIVLITGLRWAKESEIEARNKQQAQRRAEQAAANKPLSQEEKDAFDVALGRFHRVWSHDDFDALVEMGNEEFNERRWPGLQKALKRRGWEKDLPELDGEASIETLARRGARAVFAIRPKGELRTSWKLEDGIWRLRRVVPAYTR